MCPYQIEKNIPYPPNKILRIPFSEMEVGDSLAIKLEKKSDLGTIRQRVWRENKKGGMRFSCHQIKGERVRIFRTA